MDKKAFEHLKTVFNKIHSVSHYRDENWQVVLVPDKSFNAFVTGGTIAVVNKGLLDEVQNDDELAAVLGHEIAHVTASHASERQAVMLTKIRHRNSLKTKIFGIAYTVENEREADKIGILYAALAGYDPFAATQLWDRLYKKSGDNAAMLSSHPMNSERSKTTKEIASKLQQYYTPNQTNPNLAAILENNTLWQKNTSESDIEAGSGGGILAIAATTLNTMTKIQEAKNERMRQSRRINLIRNVALLLRQTGWDILSPTSYGFYFQYTGNLPIQNLVLKSDYGTEILIYSADAIIYPNQKFTAVFETNEPLQRNKIRQCCSVDSVDLAN